MRFYKITVVVLFLSIGTTYAQDTTLNAIAQLNENLSPVVRLKDEFYISPALKIYQRKYSYSLLAADYFKQQRDLYISQEGKGRGGLSVHSESYLKNNANSALWGNAYYTNEKIYKVNYNESIDYNLIYPYVMADTVGGDLTSETYFFTGGYSNRYKLLQYGFSGSFRGVQAYRAVDPRPKNISSDIHLELSAGIRIGAAYALSLDLKGRKYNQNNSLAFVNELGFPLVFHDAGLGVYNEFLAGTRTTAYFNGNDIGAHLNFAPAEGNGFAAQVGYGRFKFNKLLSGIIFPIAEVKDNLIQGIIGYTQESAIQSYIVKLKASRSKRAGTEPKFNNKDSESGIQKVSEDVRFFNERLTLTVEGVYGRKSDFVDWYVGADVSFVDNAQQYASPNRNLDYRNLILGLNVMGTKKINKALLSAKVNVSQVQNLSGDYNWSDLNPKKGLYTMLTGNYGYLTAKSLNLSGSLRLDLPVSNKLNLFVKSEGGHTAYQNNLKGTQLMLSTGFIF